MDTFWSQGKSAGTPGNTLWTPDPHASGITPAVLCALELSMGGAARTIQARQSDQVIAQPAHLRLLGVSVEFLSAEHPAC